MAAEVVVRLAVAQSAGAGEEAEREALAEADFSGALAQPASSTTTSRRFPFVSGQSGSHERVA
jgi:hypothetical protein